MTAASATIEAGILAVPNAGASAEDAHGYIDRILAWSKLLDEPWIALCLSERASEALFTDELFPIRNQLQQLFSAHGIEEYDVNTVCAVVNRLLQHTPSFETYYRVREVLSEDLTTIPDVMQFCTGEGLQADLARCMLLLAIIRTHCRHGVLQSALILKQCPQRQIRVRALVHDLEHSRDDLEHPNPAPPEHFEGDVLACDDFRGLLECIDESAVLRGALNAQGVELAIQIRLYKSRLQRQVVPDWDDIGGMTLGRRFEDSILGCCRDADSGFPDRVLRAVCEAIDRESLQAVHALRTGPGGNDPQRVRASDKAKAWRRDVDHEYHLHYWERSDGAIEFASVSVHNDFSITE